MALRAEKRLSHIEDVAVKRVKRKNDLVNIIQITQVSELVFAINYQFP
jgi:hypothetical protein